MIGSPGLLVYERTMLGAEYRLLADAVPQLVWVTDGDGAVVYVNQQYAAYTGFAAAELCGQTEWRKALHPDDLERCLADWRAAMTNGSGYETEYRLRRASDGSWRWHLARALPIRDERGAIVKWIGTCTDIEDNKRTQEALRVSEQRLLEESRRKDELLAMLGHELRNPLAPILGATQLLGEHRDPARLAEQLAIIERQVKHMARLVDDLLDVARISGERFALRRTRMELAAAIDHAVEIATPLVEARGHTLVVEIEHGVTLDADPDRLAQVISNLLHNAAKFTEPGGVIAVRGAREGDEVVLSVTDTGVGIAPHQLPHIFDLFVQGDRTLDRAPGGLGIGLTLVRRLVELHGGSVTASSRGPGHGTEMIVRLPAAPALAAPATTPPAPAPVVRERPAGRVLVVDDNPDVVSLLQDYLTWKGFDVDVAYDGVSALAVARETRPEIVLLDIGLPTIDGYKVARRLRSDTTFAGTRLIALTGYGQASDRERARQSGFHDHLVKPLDLSRLVERLVAS